MTARHAIEFFTALLLTAVTLQAAEPIRLHPENPHYLLFRGKPTILVTSTEHYGAVLNLDFDYVPYLDELQSKGLNLTRTFSGFYCEAPGNFKIQGNTLAPANGRFICPWARSDQPGYAAGGNKFDLSKWDDAYFARLKDFISQAGKRGIVVELVLFCPFYEDSMWNLAPFKSTNNVNGLGDVARNEVFTLQHQAITDAQVKLVHKLTAELAEFDNLYYEVCNEPYERRTTDAWERRIIDAIVEGEKSLPAKHLIAQNIANHKAEIREPHPAVSIFNFHYAAPPDTVAMNFHLNKVIGDDETGFRGPTDFVYRSEAWDFLLAGGAIYDNLDYSFTPDHEAGDAKPDAPGGGGATLRTQLKILKEFIEGFDFIRMKPDAHVIRGGLPEGTTARALSERGRAYAIYVKGGGECRLVLDLPAVRYKAEWLNTKTGRIEKASSENHAGGELTLSSPAYSEDIALRIIRGE